MADPATRIPVILVTGFLGSGKTTLLNNLLRHAGMADTAVVVNEFGEISIDHLVIESAIENTVVLESGCICCTVRGDLVDTLRDLTQRSERGDIPPFSRVVIETTGLAEPAPIIETLVTNPMLTSTFRLGLVVTTVDAQHGLTQLREFEEVIRQIAVTDLLLVTKSDLVGGARMRALKAEIALVNPGAELLTVVNGNLDPEFLMDRVSPTADTDGILRRWRDSRCGDDHHHHSDAEDCEHEHAHHHLHDAASGIETFSLKIDHPLPARLASDWLDALLSLRGGDILRLKGVLALEEHSGPVLIQCVQHVAYPPTRLDRWPEGKNASQLVFITRGIGRAAIEASLNTLLQADKAA